MISVLRITALVALLALFGLPSAARAQNAISHVQTGLTALDTALNVAAVQGSTPEGARQLMRNFSQTLGLTNTAITALSGQGYNYGEIYYMGLLHRQTGLPLETIIQHKQQGLGWGELAHRLGVPPSELNKARVALKKSGSANLATSRLTAYDVTSDKTRKSKGKGNGNKHSKGHGGKKSK